MKTLKLCCLITVLSSIATFSQAQSEESQMAYQAYLNNNNGLWKQLVKRCETNYVNDSSLENLYQLALAQHGLLNASLIDQDEDLFDAYLETTKDNLEKLISSEHEPGNSRALLSSIYGMEMSYSSWKGMFLGAKSSKNMEKALKIAPNSPMVWQIRGISKLFTPSMFGGDKQEALTALKKAIELYEGASPLPQSNWRYIDAYAWLGQCYQKLEKTEEARSTYHKALVLEPDFNWIKYGLLPKLNAN
ncbi:lipopolysaccharide assembly protein LapB [Fulvivirga sp. M361]|uniref:tetratricopeptide repeat protein n=1 Tax=Fulvivirga sp. M361 TaxID=2594266 RepID=UPI001628FCB8|nr:tetratricopeptide repeat protein [Fulvivirga sp. M361]